MITQQQARESFPPGTRVLVVEGEFSGKSGTIGKYMNFEDFDTLKVPVLFPRKPCPTIPNPDPRCEWIYRRSLQIICQSNQSLEQQRLGKLHSQLSSSNAAAVQSVNLQWLEPNEIELENGTQSRVVTEPSVIARYASDMGEDRWDWQHQPPVIFDDGMTKRPGDGHHRIAAAVLAGKQILCEIRHGTLIDAIRYSCSSNQRPSLHRSNADKRKAVEMMFATLISEFGSLENIPRSKGGKRSGVDWSNRRIAQHVGVSAKTVDNIYAELELTAPITQLSTDGQNDANCGTAKITQLSQSDVESNRTMCHSSTIHQTDVGCVNGQFAHLNETDGIEETSSAPQTSVEQELQKKASTLGLNGSFSQVLPDVRSIPLEVGEVCQNLAKDLAELQKISSYWCIFISKDVNTGCVKIQTWKAD